MAKASADVWASGDAYERYIGRWSRLVAREFLDWLAERPGSRWLDVGCGTGALTEAILATAEPSHVYGVDSSSDFVAFVRDRIPDPRTTFAVADALQLPPPSESIGVAVSGLALNFIDNPQAAVVEMARVVHKGGTVAVYVWDYAGEMQLLRHFWDAATTVDAGAAEFDEGRRFPICNPVDLESLFRAAGLREIESRPIDVATRFRTFDDYWEPFLGGQGPAPGYLRRLDEDDRDAVRERLLDALPVEVDGSINLMARAWAVRGRRP